MTGVILTAVAIGVAVPVVLLLGPYLLYLLPGRRRRLPDPAKNRFAEGVSASLRTGGGEMLSFEGRLFCGEDCANSWWYEWGCDT